MRRLQEMHDPSAAAIRAMLERVGSLKGEKGDTPIKYVDYFTPTEIDSIVAHIHSLIPVPENGKDGLNGIDGITPQKGIHYRDGVDGRDGKDGKSVKGKDGKDGISPSMEAIITELRKDPITYDRVEGAPNPKDLAELIAYLKRGGFRGGGSSTGGSTGNNVYNEIVAGTDGTDWVLAHVPTTGTVRLFANGQRLIPGALPNDYTILGAAITTNQSWAPGTILADYSYA